MLVVAFALLAFLGCASAIDDEFPGYIHYHNANIADPFVDPTLLTMEAFQTQCDTNISCVQMNYDSAYPATYGWLSPISQDFSVDTYYKNSSCGNQCTSTVPEFVTGGRYSPSTIYMKCSGCKMQHSFDGYLNKYSLPPSQCATACNDDQRCAAMSITNDRQTCYTYEYVGRSFDAYLKIVPLMHDVSPQIKMLE